MDSLVVGQFEKNSVLQGFGVEFPRVSEFRGGAIWLTRRASCVGGPSLRLKSGYAQDDADGEKGMLLFKLTHYPSE